MTNRDIHMALKAYVRCTTDTVEWRPKEEETCYLRPNAALLSFLCIKVRVIQKLYGEKYTQVKNYS